MPLEVPMKGSWETTVAMAMAMAMVKAMENHHTRDSAGDGILWYLLTLLRFVLCVMMVSNNKQFGAVFVSSFSSSFELHINTGTCRIHRRTDRGDTFTAG